MESSMEIISRESLTILMELQYQWKPMLVVMVSTGQEVIVSLDSVDCPTPLLIHHLDYIAVRFQMEVMASVRTYTSTLVSSSTHTHTHTHTHTNTHLQSCVSFAHTNYHPTANISLFSFGKNIVGSRIFGLNCSVRGLTSTSNMTWLLPPNSRRPAPISYRTNDSRYDSFNIPKVFTTRIIR